MAKYKELIRFSYVINPDNPFITNSRALSPTLGGETIVVAALELLPLSPSIIIKPLVSLEVIIRTLLLSSPPLFSFFSNIYLSRIPFYSRTLT